MSDSIQVGDSVQWRQVLSYKRAPELLTGTVIDVRRLVFHSYAVVETPQEHFYLLGLDELTRVEPAKQVTP